MKREINLLPTDLKDKRKDEKVKTSLGKVALTIFLVIGLLSLTLFGMLVNFSLRQDNLKKEYQRLQGKITDLAVVETEALRLQSKLSSLGQIIAEKNRYSLLLTNISKASPPEMVVSGLSSFGEGKVSLMGSVGSYSTLSRFITSLLDPAFAGKIFNAADLTGASLDEVSGKIKFSLVLHVVEGSLK